MELCPKSRKTGEKSQTPVIILCPHLILEQRCYNCCCRVSFCLQMFVRLSHCGQQKWHKQPRGSHDFHLLHVKIQVASTVGSNTAFPGAWWVYEAKHLQVWQVARHTDGRAAWQMKASFTLPHYLVITCYHSSMPMAKTAVPLIPPPLLGKHCAFQEK